MGLRKVRPCCFADAKTDWGRSISDAQLKRYLAKARKLMSEAALFDRQEEFGAARRRLERIIARAAAKGDLRTLLTANRQLCELLGLATPARLELSGPDGAPLAVSAADIRAQFEDLIEAKSARLCEKDAS
jgi:hypothetical protein